MKTIFFLCLAFVAPSTSNNRVSDRRDPLTIVLLEKKQGNSPSFSNIYINSDLDLQTMLIIYSPKAYKQLNNINSYYVGTIFAGTPHQQVDVEFDLGLQALWLLSSSLTKYNKSFIDHHGYSKTESASYTGGGTTFQIPNGQGFIGGVLVNDNINVANLTITSQGFGEATSITENLRTSKVDGAFGLGLLPESVPNFTVVDPPLVNMFEQKLIKKLVFSFYINKLSDQCPSELTFGRPNPSRHRGHFTYTPVVVPASWTISLDGVMIGQDFINEESYRATPLPGSSVFFGPTELMDPINEAIGGVLNDDGFYYVPCNNIKRLTSISFVINDRTFPLHGEDYVLEFKDPVNGSVCISGFFGVKGSTDIVLASPFLRKYYALFDVEQLRIGFATAI